METASPPDSAAPLGAGAALLAFVAAFSAAQVVGGVAITVVIVAGLVGGWIPVPTEDPSWVMAVFARPDVLLTAAVASSATFVATAWIACRLGKRRFATSLGLVRAPILAIVLAVIGVAAIGVLVDELVTLFRSFLPSFTFGVLEAFGSVARTEGVVLRPLTFVCMTLVPGFSEELFFRGLLQRALVARFRAVLGVTGTVLGVAGAALVFGAVHLDPPQALGAVLTGAFLGWIALQSRSIVPAIAAHVANNALAWVASNVDVLRRMAERHEHLPPWMVGAAASVAIAASLGLWAATRSHRSIN